MREMRKDQREDPDAGLPKTRKEVFFLLFSGMARVIRQLLWQEPLLGWKVFKEGVRQNGGRFVQAILMLALPKALLRCLTPSVAADFLQGFWAVILVPVGVWVLQQAVYYRLSFWDSLKNAGIYYIRFLPMTLFLLLATALPFWLLFRFVHMVLIKYFGLILLMLVYAAPMTMVWLLYASYIFDRSINREHYPRLYRKGMGR